MREDFVKLLQRIEKLDKEYSKLFQNTPPADKNGRWPWSYIGELKWLESGIAEAKVDAFDILKSCNLLSSITLLVPENDDEETE